MFALATLIVCELVLTLLPADRAGFWAQLVCYSAATTTLCPLVSVLGARRPQHRPWQVIVAMLWIILQVPAIQWWLLGPGIPLHDFLGLWWWFLAALMTAGLVNYLPTRFWAAALLVFVAQWILFAPSFLRLSLSPPADLLQLSLTLLALAALLVITARPTSLVSSQPLDRLWIDYRNAFGAFWALRLLRNINSYTTQLEYDVALGWRGFLKNGQHLTELQAPVTTKLVKRMKNFLWRFVSRNWIAERLGES